MFSDVYAPEQGGAKAACSAVDHVHVFCQSSECIPVYLEGQVAQSREHLPRRDRDPARALPLRCVPLFRGVFALRT